MLFPGILSTDLLQARRWGLATWLPENKRVVGTKYDVFPWGKENLKTEKLVISWNDEKRKDISVLG